ncbi:hypothetical protein B5F07_03235 [Lachnoclostridium sp. An169]|uniref:protein kinase domain-containing protein n=1 Tax=Lachnoclostridium sp. An169 TaxID=1965569 RepID=UPI000B3A6251|nr:Ig-like domain-containing protein [Lachnoclostridium sp. An169]OUP85699.1 hypothetical protein B5F07_03235 [Lachnoclostridium sp. An169]HJA67285.1 Ig-like domain-containing protein [Candidatus Mediterraneibacter cottocaccae]
MKRDDMDNRTGLPEGYRISHGGRNYTIRRYVSAGGNSIVYQAWYQDSLMPEKTHQVLVKELYPYDPMGRITRREDMCLEIRNGAEKLYSDHKKSYLLGNRVHLTLAQEGRGGIAENLDSFEENGTVYTVLTARKGKVLAEMLEEKQYFPTLEDTVACIRGLLNILELFHEHRLLHLDVSPDNIFMLEPREKGAFPTELLLLDFNSVYSMDDRTTYLGDYYPGKPGYMAPEAVLSRTEELGAWTDLYSAAAVWYTLLCDGMVPEDMEITGEEELVSPYSRLLLHEKEVAAEQVNRILRRGLRTMPTDRYSSTAEMLEDIQELSDILTGAVRIPVSRIAVPGAENGIGEGSGNGGSAGTRKDGMKNAGMKKAGRLWCARPLRAGAWTAGVLLLVSAAFLGGRMSLTADNTGGENTGAESIEPVTTENTVLDLYQFPLETDDSVVLTQQDVRYPLVDNRMDVQVQTSTAVRIMLKDYSHIRDTTEVIDTYSLFTFYTGEGDKRGWQNADLTYDFFYTEDNTLHMELPFQDPNHFNLDYVGVIFQNFNYDESELILDITRCTLIDGEGNEYEMTELLGSHLLFFDEERWQQNMITTENREYVETFDDIRGGRLIVDAQVCYLEPVLEVAWTSDKPEIATVDERGRVKGLSQGTATLTATVRDKNTGEERSTQMIVNVISKL